MNVMKSNQVKEYKNKTSYLCPLFWQHGETNEILKQEIQAMHEKKIGGFIVESRPHPDFLGDKWWQDLDCIIAEAKRLNMKVWIFDDSAYPSGYGAGIIKSQYPQYLKRYMRECHIDAIGPLVGSSFFILPWLSEDENLLKVIATKRKDGKERIEQDQLFDVTNLVENGILYWDVPEGAWRIYIIVDTRKGGEDWTKDYVNPIQHEAVTAYIDSIYEKHYEVYKQEFGKTIQGFFVDEPRFGNACGYEAKMGESVGGTQEYLGTYGTVLPFEPQLLEKLSDEIGEDCAKYLPYLWSDDSEKSQDIRYSYMNLVSKLMGKCFTGQIGEWCRKHGVELLGHVVEDNGAHARLAYGAGHFFRSMDGMSASGFDVVYHIWPEYMEGRFETPFGYLDARFFYWGLTKLATSLGHIDKKKRGITVCEVFGAYGWQEGLKLMKWITDHICVRGTNFLIPHAFSPKEPDLDCPPHFFARGTNPQWKHFQIWSNYANRICHYLTNGIHIATAAVLYHAEAEWGGSYEPFEKVVQTLMEKQIDCDVVSIDYLIDREKTKIFNNQLEINQEYYQVLIVPYANTLTKEILERILELEKQGLTIFFMSDFPTRVYYETNSSDILEALRRAKNIQVATYDTLVSVMKQSEFYDIDSVTPNKYLRCYHYHKNEEDIYFFTNESKFHKVITQIYIKGCKPLFLYDALENQSYRLEAAYDTKENKTKINLVLHPYESIFVMEGEGKDLQARACELNSCEEYSIVNEWDISVSKEGTSKRLDVTTLENMAIPGLLPEYSGDILYRTILEWESDLQGNQVLLDLGEVYESCEVIWNKQSLGVKICPPYVYNITNVIKDKNEIFITVTNTYAKERGKNIFDRSMSQEPSGLIGPVKIIIKKEGKDL